MTTALLSADTSDRQHAEAILSHIERLRESLGGTYAVADRATGDRFDFEQGDWVACVEAEVAAELLPAGGEVAALDRQSSPIAVTFPIPSVDDRRAVVIGMFHSDCDRATVNESIAALFDRPAGDLQKAVALESAWHRHSLVRAAELAFRNIALEKQINKLEDEVECVSDNLTGTYEEISLLYGLTQNLRISSSEIQLGEMALNWLGECVPAKGLAAVYLPVVANDRLTYEARMETQVLTSGECPLDFDAIQSIVEQLKLSASSQPYVGNHLDSNSAWPHENISGLVITPLGEGKNLYGWLVAVNHTEGGEFGTVEASLMNSVATILGTHGGNIDLYRQQREFLASVVRAFTSAIDAKDPYTCGHSDRVARVSVRLAQELGCSEETLNTIYMAGLVHDIGKIGIDDQVLRKPGRLTNAEFEQIKLHPEWGYKILADIPQFADVLPVVLHHHEQWDGNGYPHGLAGEDIPWLARICAVADAYDAMSSDRPYRKGMPGKKVDAIFRAGDGSQWDSRVVEAFFNARGDIHEICRRERADLTLDVRKWARSHAALQN